MTPGKHLARELGFWAVFAIATGAMISSGLFVLPGQAFKVSGPIVVLAYAAAALMVVPALLSKAELATAMPKSGGAYFFVERSMGALPGTLAGLAAWFSIALKSAFAMIGIGAFAQLIWPKADWTPEQWEWFVKAVAVACCIVFTVLNILSVRLTGRVQIVMVAVLLAVLAVFVVAGLPNVSQHPNFDNFMGRGELSDPSAGVSASWKIFATAGLVFVSFGGLTKVASVAGEVHKPGRNIPRAMFLAYVVVSLFYVAAVFVVVGVTDADDLAGGRYGNMTPLSLAADRFLGGPGVLLLSAAAILAFITTGNSGILAASRSPMAMSRDGLLPSSLQKVSRRFGTPHVSILLTGAFMIVMVLFLSIGDLVKVASTMMLILFLLMNVAVLLMRGSRIQNYRPLFRCPLFPWVQLAGIVLYAALIAALAAILGAAPLLTTGTFILAGLLWYFIYVRRQTDRESALVYMVRNVLAKEMYRSELEGELREIALERDEIVLDRFDHIIEKSTALDLDEAMPVEDFFGLVAEKMAGRLRMSKPALLELLVAREAESSTVLRPGLAIPHIVIEGEKTFDILLARSREGIVFSQDTPRVHLAFVLLGTRDERNFHLRALSAIAQIAQSHGFDKKWMQARGEQALRDVVLLAERQRH